MVTPVDKSYEAVLGIYNKNMANQIIENSNRRIYLGEFLPNNRSVKNLCNIHTSNVSHKVYDLKFGKDMPNDQVEILGTIKTINTINGKLVAELMEADIPLKFGIRGLRSSDNLKIVSIDLIQNEG